jgi:cation diffusion facilitator CzcD-associated flavoprotein CzcO
VSYSVLEKPSIIDLRARADKALSLLEAAIAKDLETLEYPAREWLPKRTHESGAHVYDVIVAGAGHCGVTTAFALKRERINNILVIEQSEPGGEGPWQSYARMPDLRTRKAVTGNELGYPNLTFRAYFEAREGVEAYKKLQRISCDEWTCYLLWLRRILDLPVENGVSLQKITPEGDLFRLDVIRHGASAQLYARRVILTTGPLSMGASNIPAEIAQGLPSHFYASAYEDFDMGKLRGKRVAVIGAGASAFDNAGAALEVGACSVDLLMRRPKVPPVSVIRWTDFSGFLQTYADLNDDQKWRMMHQVQRNAAPPTIRALKRVEAFENFRIHFDSPIIGAHCAGEAAALTTPRGTHTFDFIILATGFSFDLSKSAVIGSLADQIALWRHRYTPAEKASEKYLNSPYLGRNYEFVEREPGAAPYLKHLFCYNQASTLSMGPTGRVSGLKYGMKRLMVGVCGSFLRQDYDHYLKSVHDYRANEFEGHPWMGEP